MVRTRSATPIEPVATARAGGVTHVWVRRNVTHTTDDDGEHWDADEVYGTVPDGTDLSDRNALWNLLGGSPMLSESNVRAGEYFHCGGYWKAIRAIGRGEEIIVGANATPVDVAQILTELEAKE